MRSARSLGVCPAQLRRASESPAKGGGEPREQPASAASSPRPRLLRTARRTCAEPSPRRRAPGSCPAKVTFLPAEPGSPRGSPVGEVRRVGRGRSARGCAPDAWPPRCRVAGAQIPRSPPRDLARPPPGPPPGPACAPSPAPGDAPLRPPPPRCSICWAGARSLSARLRPGGLPLGTLAGKGDSVPASFLDPFAEIPRSGRHVLSLPLGVGARARRAAQGRRGPGGATLRRRPGWVAGRPAGGAGLRAGPGCRRGGKVRSAQSIPAREQPALLCNLSPSSNWGSVPQTVAGGRARPTEGEDGAS